MESPHGQLRPRLSDGLSSDDADRLAHMHHVSARQIPTVTQRANPALGLTGQHGANLGPLYPCLIDAPDKVLIDLFVGLDNHVSGKGVFDILQSDSSQHAISQRLDDLASLHQRGHFDTIQRPAVLLCNDRVLSYVHQPARQIP